MAARPGVAATRQRPPRGPGAGRRRRNRPRRGNGGRPASDRRSQGNVAPNGSPDGDLSAYAGALWAASSTIPTDATHPTHRWLADRRVWRPGHPSPHSLRWLPARLCPRKAQLPDVAGGFIVPLHPLADWLAAWPALPVPVHAVETIYIDQDGAKARDREGRDKVMFGPRGGGVWAIPSIY